MAFFIFLAEIGQNQCGARVDSDNIVVGTRERQKGRYIHGSQSNCEKMM